LLAASAAGLACSAMGAIPYGFAQLGGKTARMLVGFPAGGNADFVARLGQAKTRTGTQGTSSNDPR